jgi:DNA-binding NarL/FixJ family response regulator
VVDDHSIVRRGVRALLETHAGWQVCGEAGSGPEAVRQAARLKPDVVVLDIGMPPEFSGFEATRQILRAVPQTKVLILSMHESEQVVREALDAGARAFVFKSDLDSDLMTAVELLSRSKTFFTSRVYEMVVEGYLRGRGSQTSAEQIGRAPLTGRQIQVVHLLAEGKTNKEVAITLGISVKTAETHRTNIMRKLKLRSFSDLVRYAVREGLVEQ